MSDPVRSPDVDDDAIILSASPLAIATEPCNLTADELINKYDHSPFDLCKGCHVVVAKHRRDAPSTSTNRSPAQSASSHSKTLIPAETNTLLQFAKHCPKWTKSTACYPFIQRLKELLPDSGLTEAQWPSIFRYLIDQNDFVTHRWISDNILTKKLSWSKACDTFIEHFQSYDHLTALGHKYQACRQTKNQSAQDFSDEFVALCEQLGYDDQSKPVMQRYMNALSDSLYKRVNDFKISESIRTPTYDFTSVQQIVDIAIKFETSERAAHLHAERQAHTGSGQATTPTSGRTTEKYCAIHRSHTHNTDECYSKSKTQSGPSSGSYDSRPLQDKQDWKKKAICHLCRQPGHISPECPSKKTAPPGSSSSSGSIGSAPGKVEPSSETGSDGVRRSERPSVPPQRFTPSVRGVTTTSGASSIPQGPKVVVFQVESNSQFYHTLIDTGAEISLIDKTLAEELQLNVKPETGNINLAQAGATVPRIGITHPLSISAIFPDSKPQPTSMKITHEFEVMNLDKKDYQFIIGKDLLTTLFPDHLPSAFYFQSPVTSSHLPSAPSVRALTIIEQLIDDVSQSHVDPAQLMSDLVGVGMIPTEEKCERYVGCQLLHHKPRIIPSGETAS